MWSGLVVVSGVGPKHMFQVAAAEHECPVEALGPDRADPPLREGVRPRSSDRGLDYPYAFGKEDLIEGAGELRVPVPITNRIPSSCSLIANLRACWVTHAESGFLVTR
jgi:hypothetical protein